MLGSLPGPNHPAHPVPAGWDSSTCTMLSWLHREQPPTYNVTSAYCWKVLADYVALCEPSPSALQRFSATIDPLGFGSLHYFNIMGDLAMDYIGDFAEKLSRGVRVPNYGIIGVDADAVIQNVVQAQARMVQNAVMLRTAHKGWPAELFEECKLEVEKELHEFCHHPVLVGAMLRQLAAMCSKFYEQWEAGSSSSRSRGGGGGRRWGRQQHQQEDEEGGGRGGRYWQDLKVEPDHQVLALVGGEHALAAQLSRVNMLFDFGGPSALTGLYQQEWQSCITFLLWHLEYAHTYRKDGTKGHPSLPPGHPSLGVPGSSVAALMMVLELLALRGLWRGVSGDLSVLPLLGVLRAQAFCMVKESRQSVVTLRGGLLPSVLWALAQEQQQRHQQQLDGEQQQQGRQQQGRQQRQQQERAQQQQQQGWLGRIFGTKGQKLVWVVPLQGLSVEPYMGQGEQGYFSLWPAMMWQLLGER